MKFSACSKVKKFSALIFSMVFMSFSLFCEEFSLSQEKYHGESSTDSVLIRQAEDFMMEYIPYEDKTMDRLVLMHKSSNLEKIGSEQIDGLKSGSLSYKTKVQGLSGLVTMTWTNFCEDDGWIFDGTMYTKANILGQGKLSGQISVSGKYSATVYLDNITIKNNVTAGGTYGVVLGNNPRVEIPYEIFYKAKNLPLP